MNFRYIIYMMFFSFFIVCTTSHAATVCKWSDNAGVVHYTDTPPDPQTHMGSVVIMNVDENSSSLAPNKALNDSQAKTTQPPTTTKANNPTTASDPNTKNSPYQTIIFFSPQNEETLFYDNGEVMVSVLTTPQLDNRDKIILYLDGKPIQQLTPATTATMIKYVERGTHKLQAQIVDHDDKPLLSSTITFYMKQNLVNQ